METDAVATLAELADILEHLGIPYVVGGSVASGAWGEPRSTHDVDLILELSQDRVRELHRALKDRFYVDESQISRAVRAAGAFNILHLGRYEKLDLFVAGTSALDVAQMEHPVVRQLSADSERSFPITAPEVVVVRKLDWYQRGDRVSDRQWRDVLAVLRVQGERLDREQMSALAAASGLEALLAEALDAAFGDERKP